MGSGGRGTGRRWIFRGLRHIGDNSLKADDLSLCLAKLHYLLIGHFAYSITRRFMKVSVVTGLRFADG